LECQGCGEVFMVHASTEENLFFCHEYNTLLPKCPKCGLIGEP
jgi:hypothetical protein